MAPHLRGQRDAEQEEHETHADHHPRLLGPQLRELVQDAGDDVLDDGELGVEAEREQHQEEEQRPERGDRQPGDQVRVGHERQSCGAQTGHGRSDTAAVRLYTAALSHGLSVPTSVASRRQPQAVVPKCE